MSADGPRVRQEPTEVWAISSEVIVEGEYGHLVHEVSSTQPTPERLAMYAHICQNMDDTVWRHTRAQPLWYDLPGSPRMIDHARFVVVANPEELVK